MDVYIVTVNYMFEGGDTKDVFLSLESAMSVRVEENYRYKGTDYSYKEWKALGEDAWVADFKPGSDQWLEIQRWEVKD